jgi:alcohol dehydrogenase class IV
VLPRVIVYDVDLTLGMPVSLSIGMNALAHAVEAPSECQRPISDKAAEVAASAPYWNPRPVERAAIRALLDDAYHGRRPSTN